MSKSALNCITPSSPKLERSWFAAQLLDAFAPNLNIELDHNLTAFLSAIDIMITEDQQYLASTPFLIGISAPNELQAKMWENIHESEDSI